MIILFYDNFYNFIYDGNNWYEYTVGICQDSQNLNRFSEFTKKNLKLSENSSNFAQILNIKLRKWFPGGFTMKTDQKLIKISDNLGQCVGGTLKTVIIIFPGWIFRAH